MEQLKESISRYLYIVLAVAGVIAGSVCAMIVPKTMVLLELGEFNTTDGSRLFLSILLWSVLQLAICILLYSSFLKVPFLLFLFPSYGFCIGYFCSVFLHLGGLAGFFAAVFCVLPRYLVLFYIFFAAENKERGIRNRETLIRMRIKLILFAIVLLFLVAVMEAYINRYVIHFFTKL